MVAHSVVIPPWFCFVLLCGLGGPLSVSQSLRRFGGSIYVSHCLGGCSSPRPLSPAGLLWVFRFSLVLPPRLDLYLLLYYYTCMMSTPTMRFGIASFSKEAWRMMATNAQTLGELLKDKREASMGSRDKSKIIKQTVIARQLGISQPQLSRLELGDADVKRLMPDQRLLLLRCYQFTDQEVQELNQRFNLGLEPYLSRPPLIGTPLGAGVVKVRYLGTVSAGSRGNGDATDEVRWVEVPTQFVGDYDPAELFVLRVDGESMACRDVLDSIPPGAVVLFHKSLKPEAGDEVVCWLERHEMGVLKIYRPGESYTLLESYNKSHKPITIDEDNPGRLQGVALGWWMPSKRSRR